PSTPPSHGGSAGSNPAGVTTDRHALETMCVDFLLSTCLSADRVGRPDHRPSVNAVVPKPSDGCLVSFSPLLSEQIVGRVVLTVVAFTSEFSKGLAGGDAFKQPDQKGWNANPRIFARCSLRGGIPAGSEHNESLQSSVQPPDRVHE